jgi:hypothetical protein
MDVALEWVRRYGYEFFAALEIVHLLSDLLANDDLELMGFTLRSFAGPMGLAPGVLFVHRTG